MAKPKPICIVQARIGGSRFPGKVLEDINGSPMLVHQMNRLQRSHTIHKLVLAIPDTPENDPLERLAANQGWYCYRGPEDDVLARYAGAARKFKGDPIVRVTADCPLIDWGVLDGVVRLYLSGGFAYCSNNLEKSFPHGLDVEVFSAEALFSTNELASDAYDREHVTSYITSRQDRPFRLGNLRYPLETVSREVQAVMIAARLTVDYPEDIALARRIYAEYPLKDYITIADALSLLLAKPELMKLNEAKAIEHAQHLSGRFEPVSEEHLDALRRATMEAIRRQEKIH